MPIRTPADPRRRLARTVWPCLLLAACAVGPDYAPAPPDEPPTWHNDLAGLDGSTPVPADWWTTFGDPLLDELVADADAGNLDLAAALARIDEARALLQVATGEFFPDIDAAAAYTRARTSANLTSPAAGTITTVSGANLVASWELDLFGRIRRSVEAAGAGLEAAVEDHRGVQVVLQAEVAAAYVEARTLQERLRHAESNVALQRDTLQLTRDRFETGVAPGLDVAQAERNLSTSESFIPQLREQYARTLNGLAVLVGTHTGAIAARLERPAPIPEPPLGLDLGVHGDVLRRRGRGEEAELLEV